MATSIPNPHLPSMVDHMDKVAHFLMYAGIGFFGGRGLGPRARGATLVMAMIGLAAFAGLDEWHQQFIPGRASSAGDWLADVSGGTFGFLLSSAALRRRESLES
ncbi:MAG TPA: VanZ family protein [Gemmatimonadaceae bacterium]|nr:VanZ family protein [Gemmatimonadaceae bacterium]